VVSKEAQTRWFTSPGLKYRQFTIFWYFQINAMQEGRTAGVITGRQLSKEEGVKKMEDVGEARGTSHV
jgi:hypothetical protein